MERFVCNDKAEAVLINKRKKSRAVGLKKTVKLIKDRNEIEVTSGLPPDLPVLSIECGLSPDYLTFICANGWMALSI